MAEIDASTWVPATRRDISAAETTAANRRWWDAEAAAYYAEHGADLGDAELQWGPEGLRESEAHLLGDVAGADVLEVGGGAAQGARYLARQGARVVSTDLSAGMLAQARAIDAALLETVDPAYAAVPVPLVQCDALALPFADASFEIVVAAYGALPFVADSARMMRECARVLRPGGRLVISTSHPIRWAFPDAPGPQGLTVTHSYFDRRPYVEIDAEDDGKDKGDHPSYAEHHRTISDRVRDLLAAGLILTDLVEPEWPEDRDVTWGGWSPLRGRLIPGTLILCARRPAAHESSAGTSCAPALLRDP